MSRALFIGMALLVSTEVHAQWKCNISKKYVCEESGCRAIPADMWHMFDRVKGTYARCDSKGCDTAEARFSEAGVFLNIEVPGRSNIAKIATQDVPPAGMRALSFHEVATLHHTVLISFGSCLPTVSPPLQRR